MFSAPDSPWRVPFNGTFRVASSTTRPPDGSETGKKKLKASLKKEIERLRVLQRVLYAQDRYSVLAVFQAMDAAGKDGTIRAVMSGVNPAGCQVFSFKQPTYEELDHDFLWRCYTRLPERGRIGIFNRSYYEETLVVRVHPEYLGAQRLPNHTSLDKLFAERFESIRHLEQHLARNGTVVLKFWLNVGRDEQRDRLVRRIDDPERNWKFSSGDVAERKLWPAYMDAYETTVNETSRAHAPWYAIPADNKPYMRLQVARILTDALASLDMEYPELGREQLAELGEIRDGLATS